MKKNKTISSSQALASILKIRDGIASDPTGERCLIAPHPDLKKKIDIQMKKLNNRRGLIAGTLKVETHQNQVGMNDGLIYPGVEFPLGTPVAMVRRAAAERAPLRGIVRVIVVLVDFPDLPMTQTTQHFEDLFFSTGVVQTGSVKEYYKEVTHGLIDIQGEVVGPYRMPRTIVEYANSNAGIGQALPNARTLAGDAARAADPKVDFSLYDNNGDQYVDAFIVVHAGTGGEASGNKNDIWSHKWVLEQPYAGDNTTKIYAYLTVPEDCRLGVCAHELGHLLFGFPDLYDADYSSEGVGNWCLMGGGSWNNNGDTPAHPSAWCKAQQNWITVKNIKINQTQVSIPDVKSSNTAYRLWKDGSTASKEYFLVENRQKSLYDAYLPSGGLLIWHIDDSIEGNSNEVHYKVGLVQADGKKDLEMNKNRGDGGDPFPGAKKAGNFNDTTVPSSRSYAGAATNVAVENITPSGQTVKADLKVQ